MDELLKTYGDVEFVKNLKSIQFSIKTETRYGDLVYRFTTHAPDKTMFERIYPNGYTYTDIYNNGIAVSITPKGFTFLIENEMAELQESAHIFPDLLYRELGYTLELINEQIIDGKTYYAIGVQKKSGRYTALIDKDTFHLFRRISDEGIEEMNTTHIVNGVNLVESLTIYTGSDTMKCTFYDYRFNVEIDDRLFDLSKYMMDKKEREPITWDLNTDLMHLLPIGTYRAEIIDGEYTSVRQKELIQKMEEAINRNMKWYLNYVSKIPEGQPLPYHKRLGLTEEEYNELRTSFQNVETTLIGVEQLEITKNDSLICFKSSGLLEFMNTVQIDIKNNRVLIGGHILNFVSALTVDSENTILKSRWKGYLWKLNELSEVLFDKGKAKNGTLSGVDYEFKIGRKDTDGNAFISIKAFEYLDGKIVGQERLHFIF